MWKKNFDQHTNLSEHIESTESFPKTIFEESQSELSCIEIDDTPENDTWDANTAPKDQWNSEKMTLFLQKSGRQVPPLLEILEKQDNPYNGNPSFLCKFMAKDGEVQIWMLSVCLYHTQEYQKMYSAFVSQS